MRVGFVGLGAMGAPMAANLLRAGHRVRVHNRTRKREEPLAKLGAARAKTPADAAEGAEVVVTIVSDTPDVDAVLFGPAGVAEGAGAGTVVVDMSTISPAATRGFAERLAEGGVDLLDAPVSGGTEGAEKGALTIFVGGEAAALARAGPVLEAMGSTITHMGPSGSGQMAKAVNQVIIAGFYLAVAEGLELGMRAGLDPEALIGALSDGGASSWVLANRGMRMVEGTFPLGFRVALHRKDLGIALEEAGRLGLQLQVATLVRDLEDRLIAAGHGNEDVAAVARTMKKSDG